MEPDVKGKLPKRQGPSFGAVVGQHPVRSGPDQLAGQLEDSRARLFVSTLLKVCLLCKLQGKEENRKYAV